MPVPAVTARHNSGHVSPAALCGGATVRLAIRNSNATGTCLK
jgi:hypothetical protein